MKKVLDFNYLHELLQSYRYEFMDTWYYINSEDSFLDFELVKAFENLDYKLEKLVELNEEQVLFKVNPSICIIKGTVTILLIKG